MYAVIFNRCEELKRFVSILNFCDYKTKEIHFRFMLIHAARVRETRGEERDLPQRSRIFTCATHNAILLRAASLRGKAACRRVHTSELCVHEWCPQAYAHVRISTCPPARPPPIFIALRSFATLTLFQLPRKSRLREILTSLEGGGSTCIALTARCIIRSSLI